MAGPSPPLGTVAAVARSDPARVHAARVTGAATAVRDVIVSDAGSDRQRRHRAEWPELWELLDALADVVAQLVQSEVLREMGYDPDQPWGGRKHT